MLSQWHCQKNFSLHGQDGGCIMAIPAGTGEPTGTRNHKERGEGAMGREFELKYRATPEDLKEIQREYGTFTSITMETVYYDTPDRDMKRLRWTLRRRLENGTSVCSLKTPGDGIRRGEWETEGDAMDAALPALARLGAPEELQQLTAKGISPVCGARFVRLAALISLPTGTVELALDEGILLGAGKEVPLCEVEVELKAGSDDAALAFGAALAEKYHLTPETKGKVERAMALV